MRFRHNPDSHMASFFWFPIVPSLILCTCQNWAQCFLPSFALLQRSIGTVHWFHCHLKRKSNGRGQLLSEGWRGDSTCCLKREPETCQENSGIIEMVEAQETNQELMSTENQYSWSNTFFSRTQGPEQACTGFHMESLKLNMMVRWLWYIAVINKILICLRPNDRV